MLLVSVEQSRAIPVSVGDAYRVTCPSISPRCFGSPITREVIDTLLRTCLAESMRNVKAREDTRFDGTLRAVMWMDAFLSVALALVSIIASPIVATFGLPHSTLLVLGLILLGCAVLLAAFGTITAVLIMLRMQTGQCVLPAGLRLPLPAPMRPAPSTFRGSMLRGHR